MEATGTTVDPLAMPKGLSQQEQQWWSATVARIEREKAEAISLSRDALMHQFLADRARKDYGELLAEYRARWEDRLPQWAVGIRFRDLSVAKECISDDGWYSRQATECAAVAGLHYQEVVRLMNVLRDFMRTRTAGLLAAVPGQREPS